MYNKALVGERPALKGDTVRIMWPDGTSEEGWVVQDGCDKSLVRFGNEQGWYDNESLELVESHGRNADYLV